MLYTNPILEQFLSQAEKNPHKEIIIETSNKKATAKELANKSLQVAINLSQSGFKKDDRVLILVRPGIDLVVFILAVMRLGGVILIADPGMGKDVFKNRVKLAHPKWIFGESIVFAIQHHPIIKYFLRKKGFEVPEISSIKGIRNIRLGIPLPGSFTAISFNSLIRQADTSPSEFLALNTDDEAMIVFTSGTTSLPKGVVHTVSSLSETIKKIAQVCNPSPSDIFNASLAHFLLLSVALGVTAILAKEKFSAETYFKTLKEYKPTVLFGPPAEFIELINYCRQNEIKFPPHIKKVFLGSAPVLSGFLTKLITYLPTGTQVTCMYGMTEMLPVAVVNGRKKANWKGEGDLLGSFVSGVKYKISPDGELLLSGDHKFRNYLGQGKSNYVTTGDLVKIKDKELVLIGRKKDMIIKGNYNIYPELYESTIQKIEGVAACAMVGVRDIDKEDERIILAIEPEDFDTKDIKQLVASSLKSGDYSIDAQAFPDQILIMKLPRFGRQLKVDKNKLRVIISNKYL